MTPETKGTEMPPIYVIHIAAGLIGLLSGFVALYSVKGLPIHRKAGMVFVWTMLPMALFGMIMSVAFSKAPKINITIGLLTIYLVTTSFAAVSRRWAGSRRINIGGLVIVLGVIAADLTFGISALVKGNKGGAIFFIFAIVGIFAAAGDIRVIRSGALTGGRRLARHLWRMCFALAVGSMAFFIGQAQVFPKPIRIYPLLASPLLLVLITMFVWLWRVRQKHVYARVATRAQLFERTAGILIAACVTLSTALPAQSLDRAKQLFGDLKYAEAKTELHALQKAGDQLAATSYYLGRIAIIENDGDGAVRNLERAVKLDDRSGLYHAWLGNAIREITPRSSKFRMPLNARRMKKEWERALQLDPDLIEARFGLVQFYTYAPGFMGGDRNKAREQIAELTRRNAMRGALARGIMAELEKNGVEEDVAYKLAIASSPDSSAGYFALSAMYSRMGNADDAYATLGRYERRHPDDRRTLYEVGRVAGSTGKGLDRGEDALKQFLASPPPGTAVTSIAGAHFWLGKIAEKRGAKDAAREQFRIALKINPYSQLSKQALDEIK